MPRRPDPSDLPFSSPSRGDRLQRVMADAGIASRRDCEALIEMGRVSVNGTRVDRLPVFVNPKVDRIEVEGRPIAREAPRAVYLMMNKPGRTLTVLSAGADDDRPTALGLIDHPSKPRLVPIGGLDFDTTGLLIFTNDGELVHKLTHPRFGTTRTYEATIKGSMTAPTAARLAKGVFVLPTTPTGDSDAPKSAPKSAPKPTRMRRDDESTGRKVQMDLVPKNRREGVQTVEVTTRLARDEEIMKALALVGHPVRRLHRVAIGPLVLKGLAPGHWRELDRYEVRVLKGAAKLGARSAGKPRVGTVRAPGDSVESPVPAPKPSLAPRRRPRVIGGSP